MNTKDPIVEVTCIRYMAKNLNGSPYPKKVSKEEAERINREDVGTITWCYKTSFIIRESELKLRIARGAEYLEINYL